MTQVNDLATITSAAGSVQKFSPADAEDLLKSGFLPRLQVCGSSSEAVKAGLVQMGRWGAVYSKDRAVDLGTEVDFLVLAYRPKALRLPPGGNPLSYYNRENPEFKKIMAESRLQDSGCMYGVEFLIWMPVQDEFETLFNSSFTARKETPAILTEMKKNPDGTPRENYGPAAVTGRIHLFGPNAKKQTWHGGKFFPCNSQLASMPTVEDLQEELNKFNNPPESVEEKAEAPARAR